MRKVNIFLFFAFVLCLPGPSLAGDVICGIPAPYFKVLSGDSEWFSLDNLKGKVGVLFYESKNAIERNRNLKIYLKTFYAAQPASVRGSIVRAGIINCKNVLLRGIWERELRDNSLKERIMIYGDWSGNMSSAYHAAEDESTVIIIDKKGVIRYQVSGLVKDKDIAEIIALIRDLVKEGLIKGEKLPKGIDKIHL